MIMKIVSLFLFFSINSFAWDLVEKEVYLPLDLSSVKGIASSDKGIKLNIIYKKFKTPESIKPINNLNTSTIKKYLEKLLYVYKKQDLKTLESSMISSKSISMLDGKSTEQKVGMLSLYSQAIRPVVYHIYKYGRGFIVSWGAENFQQPMQVFLIKENNNFKMNKFHASKDDEVFWNSNNFLKYYPFEKYTPKLTVKFDLISKIDIKELEFKLKKSKTYLNLFKKDSEVVSLVAIDNYSSENYRFKDHDDREGFVKLKLSGRNFVKKGKHKIYYMESNYPLGKVTIDLIRQSKSFTIIKE